MWSAIANTVGAVATTVIMKDCHLVNDTEYRVDINDWDGAHALTPGTRAYNYLYRGFSVKLKMTLKTGNTTEPKTFDKFDGTDQLMSEFFKNEIAIFKKENTKEEYIIEDISYRQIATIPSGASKSKTIEVGWTSNEKKSTSEENKTKLSMKLGVKPVIQGIEIGGDVGQEKEHKIVTDVMSSMEIYSKSTLQEDWKADKTLRNVFTIIIKGNKTINGETVKGFEYVHPNFIIVKYADEEAPKLSLKDLQNMKF